MSLRNFSVLFFGPVLSALLVGGCGTASTGKSNAIELVDSAEVTIIESVPCESPDKSKYTCLNLKAIVDADASNQPLDDALNPTNVILSVRLKKGVSLRNRWIVFESGGHGNGYGPESGNVPPGHYQEGGRGYGDDLIRWYNEQDYVTLDIIWECPSGQPDAPCFGNTALENWVPVYPHGTGWFRNTGGAGYAGAASRTRAILDWVRANNGGKKVGAHGHSSGSGRLMAVLTRYRGESYFDTMVLDGGPVLTYFPWFCGITDDGDPDNGVIACGYFGAVLLAGTYLAIASMTSALTRNQVIAFVLAVVLCLLLVLVGFSPVTDLLARWASPWRKQSKKQTSFSSP